jgi:hypothetical protein
VPTKKPTINVVVSEELKRAIEKWAEAEDRTQSNLCERLLRDAAKDKGYLPSAQGDNVQGDLEQEDSGNPS